MYNPTEEQAHAVELSMSGQNIVIEALAGTGKTSTLEFVSSRMPHRRGLYAAFNAETAAAARQKFHPCATSRTMHSLAFASHGRLMKDRLQSRAQVSWQDKARVLGVGESFFFSPSDGARVAALSKRQLVQLTTDTVEKFLRSTGEQITSASVYIPEKFGEIAKNVEHELRVVVAGFAKRYWEDLQNPNGVLKYTHDVYLKCFQLSKPTLPYDYIMLDEAQDSDPLVIDILKRQSAQIIVVGDRNQSIYSWRGAKDAMSDFGGQKCALTQSFRFGAAIADTANQWLELLDEQGLRLRGAEGKPSSVWESKRYPEAVVTRTNSGALAEVMRLQAAGVDTGVAGKYKKEALTSLANAALQLQEKGCTTHPELEIFKTWEAAKEFSESKEGEDIKPLVDLVENFGARTIVKALEGCVQPDQARTVVSTAHVAKGLEWKHVRISDDFYAPGSTEGGEVKPIKTEQARLAYVAVTRAFRHLDDSGLAWISEYVNAGGRCDETKLTEHTQGKPIVKEKKMCQTDCEEDLFAIEVPTSKKPVRLSIVEPAVSSEPTSGALVEPESAEGMVKHRDVSAKRLVVLNALKYAIEEKLALEKASVLASLEGVKKGSKIPTPIGNLSFSPAKRPVVIDEERLIAYVDAVAPEMIETRTVRTIVDSYREALVRDVVQVENYFMRTSNGEVVEYAHLGEEKSPVLAWGASAKQKHAKARAKQVIAVRIDELTSLVLDEDLESDAM